MNLITYLDNLKIGGGGGGGGGGFFFYGGWGEVFF